MATHMYNRFFHSLFGVCSGPFGMVWEVPEGTHSTLFHSYAQSYSGNNELKTQQPGFKCKARAPGPVLGLIWPLSHRLPGLPSAAGCGTRSLLNVAFTVTVFSSENRPIISQVVLIPYSYSPSINTSSDVSIAPIAPDHFEPRIHVLLSVLTRD